MTNTAPAPQGLPPNSGCTFQEGLVFWACAESPRPFDRIRLRILHPLGNCLLAPFDNSEQYIKWHELQIFYLLAEFSILPGSGTYIVNVVMLFISVRIWKEFDQVLNRAIFFRARILLASTY